MKGLIGIILATLIILFLGIFILGRGDSVSDNQAQSLGDIEEILLEPEFYDLGSVPIKGGLVIKEYRVKNTTDKVMKLKKLATSCMCTKAKIKIGDKETKLFGMEGHGDKNPPVNLDFPAGSEGVVTVQFDPNAHGPQGVGPIDRSVFLTFSDPGGIKELKFKGTVVN